MTKCEREREERRTAYHEAGHVVAAYVLRWRFKHVSVAPEPDGALGYVQFLGQAASVLDNLERGAIQRLALERLIIRILAGHAAEAEAAGQETWRVSGQDGEQAVQIISRMCRDGAEAKAYLRWLSIRTSQLIQDHWFAVLAIAAELLEHRKVTYRKAREIIRAAGSPT